MFINKALVLNDLVQADPAAAIVPDDTLQGFRYAVNDVLAISTALPPAPEVSDYVGGFRFDDTGRLYVTTTPPANAREHQGFIYNALGQLVVSSSPVARYNWGWPLDAAGYVCMTVGGGGGAPGAFFFFGSPSEGSGIDISWTASAGAITFEIWRDGVLVHSELAAGSLFVWHDPITVGAYYSYTMFAINGGGTTASDSNPQIVDYAKVPDTPIAPVATAGDTTASIAFTPPYDNNRPIDQYQIQAFVGATPGAVQNTSAPSPYIFTGLTNGTAYSFKIACTNAVGQSGFSSNSNIVTPTGIGPPPDFTAMLTYNLTTSGPVMTFTRATTASIIDLRSTANVATDVQVSTCAINEARFTGARRIAANNWSDQYAAGGAIPPAQLLGYFAEGAATNLNWPSENFTHGNYTKVGLTAAAGGLAPDYATTSNQLTATAGNTTHTATPGAISTRVVSCFFKANAASWVGLSIGNVDALIGGAFFNLTLGTIGTVAAGRTAYITPAGLGWYRCEVAQAAPTSSSSTISIHTADGQASIWNAAGTETILVWGIQSESAPDRASSYIKTTTTSASRSSDLIALPSAGIYDATVGSLYAEIQLSNDLDTPVATIVTFGASRVFYISAAQLVEFTDDVTIQSFPGALVWGTPYKIGYRWGGADKNIVRDGVAGTPTAFDGSLLAGATENMASNASGDVLFGNIKDVRQWLTELTDAQLITLTS